MSNTIFGHQFDQLNQMLVEANHTTDFSEAVIIVAGVTFVDFDFDSKFIEGTNYVVYFVQCSFHNCRLTDESSLSESFFAKCLFNNCQLDEGLELIDCNVYLSTPQVLKTSQHLIRERYWAFCNQRRYIHNLPTFDEFKSDMIEFEWVAKMTATGLKDQYTYSIKAQ